MPSTSDGLFPASSNKKVYPVNSSGFSLTYPIVAALSSFPSSPTAFDPNNNLYTFVYVIVVSSSVLSVRTNSYPSISDFPSLSGCAPSSVFNSIVLPSAVSCTHFVISFLVTGLFFAFTFASSECVPSFSATAFTSLPSLTWFAGIVTTPVVGSIVIDGSVPSGNFHCPFASFVATRVPWWSFSSVYVIWTTSTSLSVGGVTVTDPSSFAFSSGAAGLAGVAFSFTVVFSVAGFLSFSVCFTTIFWPFTRVFPSGTFTDQVPSSFTLVFPINSLPLITTISDPATPVPEIVLSPSVTSLITGFSEVSSFFLVAIAVIFALSFVIAVPGVVDHVGFSNPSFAVTVGYLSAGNFVPSFTS